MFTGIYFLWILLLSTSLFTSRADQILGSLVSNDQTLALEHSVRQRGIGPNNSIDVSIPSLESPGFLTRRAKHDHLQVGKRLSHKKSCDTHLSQDKEQQSSWIPSIQRRTRGKSNSKGQGSRSNKGNKIGRAWARKKGETERDRGRLLELLQKYQAKSGSGDKELLHGAGCPVGAREYDAAQGKQIARKSIAEYPSDKRWTERRRLEDPHGAQEHDAAQMKRALGGRESSARWTTRKKLEDPVGAKEHAAAQKEQENARKREKQRKIRAENHGRKYNATWLTRLNGPAKDKATGSPRRKSKAGEEADESRSRTEEQQQLLSQKRKGSLLPDPRSRKTPSVKTLKSQSSLGKEIDLATTRINTDPQPMKQKQKTDSPVRNPKTSSPDTHAIDKDTDHAMAWTYGKDVATDHSKAKTQAMDLKKASPVHSPKPATFDRHAIDRDIDRAMAWLDRKDSAPGRSKAKLQPITTKPQQNAPIQHLKTKTPDPQTHSIGIHQPASWLYLPARPKPSPQISEMEQSHSSEPDEERNTPTTWLRANNQHSVDKLLDKAVRPFKIPPIELEKVIPGQDPRKVNMDPHELDKEIERALARLEGHHVQAEGNRQVEGQPQAEGTPQVEGPPQLDAKKENEEEKKKRKRKKQDQDQDQGQEGTPVPRKSGRQPSGPPRWRELGY